MSSVRGADCIDGWRRTDLDRSLTILETFTVNRQGILTVNGEVYMVNIFEIYVVKNFHD